MRKTVRVFSAGTLFFVFGTAAVWAQETAQISGSVADQSGAAVGGAVVKATQTATGASRSVVAQDDGLYSLRDLPVGPYILEASHPGFRSYVQTGIVLQVNASPTINVVLQVGEVTQTIDVTADAALVETSGTGVGSVIDNKRVEDLPLNGRVPTQLIFLAGMSQPGAQATLVTQRNYPTQIAIAVAGGTGEGVNYMLDGVNHTDGQNYQSFVMPFPDALQEFKVESSALAAQYGYHSDAVVTAITKSGTNELHGDAFEFVRNGDFNARNYFAPTRDSLKRNQYGGVIGGPIKKDRLFYFGGYQRTDNRTNPSTTISYIPTAAMLQGDFTTIASPQCNNGRQITLPASKGFVNNTLSPSLLSPVALNLQKFLPTPINNCGEVIYGIRANTDENIAIGRVDFLKTEKSTWFLRAEVTNLDKVSSYNGVNPLTILSPASHFGDKSLAIGNTYLLSTTIVNSFHAAVTRSDVYNPDDKFENWSQLGAQNFTPVGGDKLQMTVTGAFGIGGNLNNNPTGPNTNIADDVSWQKGKHQFVFGATYLHTIFNQLANYTALGSATFNGSVTGLALADWMLGDASSWSQADLFDQASRQNLWGVYAQDTWRALPRLTINYGLRYEPNIQPYDAYDRFDVFEPNLFAQNVHSVRFPSGPAGLLFDGDPGWNIGNAPTASLYGSVYPRVGLAWDVFGDGKTAIRSAYGMFVVTRPLGNLISITNDAPWGNTVSLANVNINNPWATYPGGNPFPYTVTANTPFPLYSSIGDHLMHEPLSYQNQWNFDIERQFGKDWLVTASYLGNNTIHLVVPVQLNPAIYLGTGPCTINNVNYSVCSTTSNTNQRRQLYLENPSQGQYYSTINVDENIATQSYNGLLLKAQKRISRGTSVLATYTWSHCLSYPYDFPQSAGLIYSQVRSYRSNCPTGDVRQVFVLSAVAQAPKIGSGIFGKIASNWALSPIVTARSAQWVTVYTGVDNALNGQTSIEVPNLVGSPYPANQGPNNWLNVSSFQYPAAGTTGNLGVNSLKGPDFFDIDMAISRTFALKERQSVQVRADFFNLTNHTNFMNPVSTLSSSTFGKILAANDPRILQFAAKYVF